MKNIAISLYIYINIVSVYFAYNMQTATWWTDGRESRLKGDPVCMWGIPPTSSAEIHLANLSLFVNMFSQRYWPIW